MGKFPEGPLFKPIEIVDSNGVIEQVNECLSQSVVEVAEHVLKTPLDSLAQATPVDYGVTIFVAIISSILVYKLFMAFYDDVVPPVK